MCGHLQNAPASIIVIIYVCKDCTPKSCFQTPYSLECWWNDSSYKSKRPKKTNRSAYHAKMTRDSKFEKFWINLQCLIVTKYRKLLRCSSTWNSRMCSSLRLLSLLPISLQESFTQSSLTNKRFRSTKKCNIQVRNWKVFLYLLELVVNQKRFWGSDFWCVRNVCI